MHDTRGGLSTCSQATQSSQPTWNQSDRLTGNSHAVLFSGDGRRGECRSRHAAAPAQVRPRCSGCWLALVSPSWLARCARSLHAFSPPPSASSSPHPPCRLRVSMLFVARAASQIVLHPCCICPGFDAALNDTRCCIQNLLALTRPPLVPITVHLQSTHARHTMGEVCTGVPASPPRRCPRTLHVLLQKPPPVVADAHVARCTPSLQVPPVF